MKLAKQLRRAIALSLAVVAVWWLVVALEPRAEAQQAAPWPGGLSGQLNVWERLALGQSPFLTCRRVLTADSEEETEPQETAAPEQPQALEQEDETPLPSSSGQTPIAQTFLPSSDGAYLSAGEVSLYNRTNLTPDVEALAQTPVTLSGEGKGPQILIIHTHATEAYSQMEQDSYAETDPYRTTDEAHNVLRIGDELAAIYAQNGLNVLHDRTLHDYPSYSGAYTRSRDTVEEYLAAYPSISVVLDVHRDALIGGDGAVYKAVADQSVLPGSAQVMLVVGTNDAGGAHPDWQNNLALAMTLERAMDQQAPTLARPITLRSATFNQQLSPGSLLLEVGTHGNTLQESITAVRSFAQITAPVLKELLSK